MTTPDPITTAREALDKAYEVCRNLAGTDESDFHAIATVFDLVEKLKAERDEQKRRADQLLIAANFHEDAATRLQAERDVAAHELKVLQDQHVARVRQNNQYNDDRWAAVRERDALTSQLEQAEKVIAPFADAALSPGGRRWGLTVTAERLFEGEESSPLPKTDDFVRAEKWIKDRQAKGEG